MKYSWTILNVPILLFLIFCLIFTIAKYKVLSANEGWGMVGMMSVFVITMTALVIDFIIHNVIKNSRARTIVRGLVLIAFAVFVYSFFSS